MPVCARPARRLSVGGYCGGMASATLALAVDLARQYLGDMEPRWTHVRVVGSRAEELCRDSELPEDLAAAAWLHDLGYAQLLATTGFHPLDGARFLRSIGTNDLVTSLVAYHSGAAYEAEERGLVAELSDFTPPPGELLDTLVLLDMTTGPTGERVSVDERVADILSRYRPSDPVFRAISRSGQFLRESAARAAQELGLADVGTSSIL